jgi:hypothetical protein
MKLNICTISILFFIFLTVFASCGKSTQSPTDYLTKDKWFFKDTVGFEDCDKDNYIHFKKDKTVIEGYGEINCFDEEEDYMLNWEFRDSFEILRLTDPDDKESYIDYEIIKLDSIDLIIKSMYFDDPFEYIHWEK